MTEITLHHAVSRAKINLEFLELLERWERDSPDSEAALRALLEKPRIGVVDLNAKTRAGGTTLLHEAVRRKDTALIELAVRKGADVFGRNRRGKRVLESTKDEKIKALLQQLSNADAAMAASAQQPGLPPTFRGYLAKWTNIAGGYKTRWFVLENGTLSYYATQDEEGKQSRGSINLKFAKIRADNNDKHRFEVISEGTASKSAHKLYLRGSHPVERARWVQVLQQTVEFFELDRTTSRAESVRSVQRADMQQNIVDASQNTSSTLVSSPTSVPSRTTTPFRVKTPSIKGSALGRTISGMSSSFRPGTSARSAESNVVAPMGSIVQTPSILSRDSRTPSDEQLFEQSGEYLDPVKEAPNRIPHENEFALVANSLRTQVDLSHQLAHSLSSSSSNLAPALSAADTSAASSQTGATVSTRVPSLTASSPDNIRQALQDSLQNSATLLSRYQEIVANREAYLTRRYEQEIQAKHLWEENLKTLAQQHADMEAQLREAAQDNARKRKALREVRENFASSPSAGVLSPGPAVVSPKPVRGALPFQTSDAFETPTSSLSARRSEAPDSLPIDPSLSRAHMGTISSINTITADNFLGESEADDGDEFFDAVESGNLPGLKIEDAVERSREGLTPAVADADSPKATDNQVDDKALVPYTKLRHEMPIDKDNRPSVSLWSILKNNIGKDLTKISFPVSLNEPTSMLQRMAEDMTYASLLDTAVRQESSTLRIAFVAAFACSNYVTTLGRVAKPFNPLLGETFEFASLEGCKYRYQSEQVSHHPPISACIAESLEGEPNGPSNWEYAGCVQAQSKFLGRSFEIRPTGMAHVRLNVGGKVEHYSFKKVTTSVSGFVTGSPTIDHYGDMVVKCHTTGDECTMTFKPRGWRSSVAHELKGSVVSGADGNLAWEIAGRWSNQIVARKVNAAGGDTLDPDRNVDSLSSDPSQSSNGAQGSALPELVLLWKYHSHALGPFNLTPYAIMLNDLPAGLHDWLPTTDCRLRPDLRLFETGRFDEADVMKRNLEELQRATRKAREAGEKPPHKPRWFSRVVEPDTQADYWEPRRISPDGSVGIPEYWAARSKQDWANVDSIFGEYTA